MLRNSISMSIKTLKATMEDNPSKDTIEFNSPIQRKIGMWDDKRKSKLIHSIIEEAFSRLNSAVPLTSAQFCKAKAGTDVVILLNDLLTSKFFTVSATFTKAQIKASDDQRCLLQAMMLLDRNYVAGFKFKDFSEMSLMEYAESIKDCYSDKQSNLLRSTVQYLTDAFPENNKQLKKISIPMLLYVADVAEDTEIKPMYFRKWWEFFTEEDALFEDYKLFCSSGSTNQEKVNGRLAVMVKSFCDYQEIEIPEELKDMVAEAEEKITAIKAESMK